MITKNLLIAFMCFFSIYITQAQSQIGIIEVYGNRFVTDSAVLLALPIKTGDVISRTDFNYRQVIDQLKKTTAIKQAAIAVICCTEDKKEIVYVGIEETDSLKTTYRKAPTKPIQLPSEMTTAYDSLMKAIREAVLNGQSTEDLSQGHSLLTYPKANAIQEKFVSFAVQQTLLRNVLHNAKSVRERAIAVTIIAYAKDKGSITDDLLFAVSDPDESVRNNAIRALSVLAAYASDQPERNIKIPAQPFINMLNSLVWTDRNKASLVLLQLTNDRNPEVLMQLHQQALPALIEMAQWKDKGHAMPSFIILGRMAGLKDEKLFEAFNSNSFSDTLQDIIQKVQSN